jgi:hypothetical protein
MMKYMDFLEKKLIEIIQLNTDNLKEVVIFNDIGYYHSRQRQ